MMNQKDGILWNEEIVDQTSDSVRRAKGKGERTGEGSSLPKRGKGIPCSLCNFSGRGRDVIPFGTYESPQISLLFFSLLSEYPELTPETPVCRPCLQQHERRFFDRQLLRKNGELYYVDPSLDGRPILPTPERIGASSLYTGKGVTIAFVDSGFAPHPDLILPVNRVLAAYNAVIDREVPDFEGYFSDGPPPSAWHGTMTATVAAGSGHLSDGYYRGIAPDARLVLIKAMTPEHRIRTPQVRQALKWIRENHEKYNIRVVNLSLGVDEASRSMRHPVIALVEDLVARGIVVVAASGNNPTRPLVPPGSAPSAITVGGYNDHNSADHSRHELWNSAWGKSPTGGQKPELLGPAIWVAAPILLRTKVKAEAEALFYLAGADDERMMRAIPVLANETGITKSLLEAASPHEARGLVLERIRFEKQITPSYKHVDGTSFAAPIVSSIVAQMLEADPDLTPARIKERLIEAADPIPGVPSEIQGYGVVRPGIGAAGTPTIFPG